MSTPEAKFSGWLREALPGHCHRIENAIASGTPDISWCYLGVEVWIETKFHVDCKALIRPMQYSWGMRRASHGGRVAIIVANDLWIHIHRFPCTGVLHGKYIEIGRTERMLETPRKVSSVAGMVKYLLQ